MSGNAKKTFRGPQSSHDAFDSIVERARAMSGLNLSAADALVWMDRWLAQAVPTVGTAMVTEVVPMVVTGVGTTVGTTDEPTPAPRTHADDSYNLSSINNTPPYSPSAGNPHPRAADNRGVVVALPEDELTPHQLRTAQRVLHRWGKTLSAKYGAVEPCDSIPPALARAVQRWPSSRQWDSAIDRLDDMSKAAIARYSMTTLEHACRAPRSQPGGLPKLFEDYRAAQKDPPPLHEVLSGKQLDNWRKPPESVTAPTADDAERWCRLLAENDPVWWIELTAEMRRKAGKVRENGADPDAVLIGQQHWSLGANGDGPAWRGLLDPIIRAAIQQTQQREEDEG